MLNPPPFLRPAVRCGGTHPGGAGSTTHVRVAGGRQGQLATKAPSLVATSRSSSSSSSTGSRPLTAAARPQQTSRAPTPDQRHRVSRPDSKRPHGTRQPQQRVSRPGRLRAAVAAGAEAARGQARRKSTDFIVRQCSVPPRDRFMLQDVGGRRVPGSGGGGSSSGSVRPRVGMEVEPPPASGTCASSSSSSSAPRAHVPSKDVDWVSSELESHGVRRSR